MKLATYLEMTRTTARDFADHIGVHESTVSRVARGVVKPDWATMQAIAKATDGVVEPNDFLNLPSNDAPQQKGEAA